MGRWIRLAYNNSTAGGQRGRGSVYIETDAGSDTAGMERRRVKKAGMGR